ncbi:unnamed protein product [Arabis nemorensis]|uniref:Uncharacterized protein n=1 Tax=Arabis nemorensis TaxID=586526 RepID=A0A565C4G4_9BRAS|nr:unnamed protein product [Arabis nemorensis]
MDWIFLHYSYSCGLLEHYSYLVDGIVVLQGMITRLVWNYKTHECLFTLLGHLDYIRTVQFHHEN